MEVTILGCESMGVRSLATVVKTQRHCYLLDPGVSVPPRRSRLPPHPLELAASYATRQRIMKAADSADTIVLTHYHHDHFTPFAFRRDEWSDQNDAAALYQGKRLIGKAPDRTLNRNQRRRARTLRQWGFSLQKAAGRSFGELCFSTPVPHGEEGTPRGCVIMALIEEGDQSVAFASDIQLLNAEAVELLLAWKPAVCILSGPPLYLDVLTGDQKREAYRRAEMLCRSIPTVVIDHHLARTTASEAYLARLGSEASRHGNSVLSGAAFAARPPLLLEAQRKELFARWPPGKVDYLGRLARREPKLCNAFCELAERLQSVSSLEDLGPELWDAARL